MTEALASAAQVVAAYSVQLAAVVVTGLALCGLLRLRAPRVHLAVAQALLVLALALPWLQPPRRGGGPSGHVTVTAVAWGLAPGPAAGTLPAVAGLLALGAAWRLARLARGVWRLRRCRRLSRVLPPSPPVRDAWARVGVEARVVVSEEVDVPAAFGVLRPVVLVPGRFTVLGEAAQRAVLCHELLHVRRHDWLQMLAEEVAGALLWFHPAVWWLRARIRLAREQVVDQEAVALTGDRRVYLETLVGLARVPVAAPAPAPLFLTESHLGRRVDVLLKEVTMSKTHVRVGLAASAAGVALAGFVAAQAFPLEGPPDAQASAAVAAPAGGAAGAAGKKVGERTRTVMVDPTYPAEAKKKGVEGSVVLDVLITAAGDVKDVKVTSGPAELADSAASAVRQWKFAPGPRDTRATLTVRYVLAKKEQGAARLDVRYLARNGGDRRP